MVCSTVPRRQVAGITGHGQFVSIIDDLDILGTMRGGVLSLCGKKGLRERGMQCNLDIL